MKKEAADSGQKGARLKQQERKIDEITMKDRGLEQKRYLKTLYAFK